MLMRHAHGSWKRQFQRLGFGFAVTAAVALLVVTGAVAAPAPPQNQSRPTITGTPTVGKILTAQPGNWSGTQPITFAFQWRRCDPTGVNCNDIAEASQSLRYIATSGDVGHRLRVSVTASNSDGRSTATSQLSTALKPAPANAPVNTSPPAITGPPVEGNAMTTSDGNWTGAVATNTTYQWQRCGPTGAGCDNVLGATASTYTPTGLDDGNTLRAIVTVTNQFGSASSISHQTAAIRSASSSQVSLDSNAAIVVYGARVQLSGAVGGSTGGDAVTILARPSDARSLQSVGGVQTDAGGSFADIETPQMRTVYVARALGQTSDPVAVSVRPLLTLRTLSHHALRLQVAAAASFVGRYAEAQVWNARSRVWVSARRVFLTGRTIGASPTIVSSATFRLSIKPGRRVRVFMQLSQTAPAYLSGSSNAVRY